MNSKLSIREALDRVEYTSDVEVIDVPVAGEKIALMRVRSMPEFAFVMWVSCKISTRTQIAFRIRDRRVKVRFSVVSAACTSERYGIKEPKDKSRYDAWEQELKEQFKEAIVAACRANGISTIFVHFGIVWDAHYGRVEGLTAVDAEEYFVAYGELYGRKCIRDAFRFIDEGRTIW